MGGARCTYRNCTVKTDGKVHMFHYPVFDKVRCHQWLTNAQRLDFLNLKVSQLRNRVVCQHHFKPDCFMNYKMDKLRCDATPTENGPFCNVEELANNVEALPICPDEIDIEKLTFTEKKANFSVKYGDFLINSETDTDKLTLITADLEGNVNQTPFVLERKPFPNTGFVEVEVPDISNQGDNAYITINHRPRAKNKVHIISEKKISTPVAVKGKLEPVDSNTVLFPRRNKPQPVEPVQLVENIENMNIVFRNPNENTVDLANSEITFYPQTLEPHDLQVISMNQHVDFPPVIQNYDPNAGFSHIQVLNPETIPDTLQTMLPTAPQHSYNPVESIPLKNKNNEINKPSQQSSPKSLLKNKIPPERVAAIEEKRKFNKKLRDMIEFCLDETPEKVSKENSILNTTKKKEPEIDTLKIIEELKKPMEVKRMTAQIKESNNKKRVSSYLSEEPNLPSASEYNLSSIEARLKKMEENLLHRIEQNTQKIGELKQVIETGAAQKKSVMTQCIEDEQSCKKHLYKEISQFLSPEANSLIYEELFLNKYSKKPVEKSAGYSTKRRKNLR